MHHSRERAPAGRIGRGGLSARIGPYDPAILAVSVLMRLFVTFALIARMNEKGALCAPKPSESGNRSQSLAFNLPMTGPRFKGSAYGRAGIRGLISGKFIAHSTQKVYAR